MNLRRLGAVLTGLTMAGSLAVIPAFLAPAAAVSAVPCRVPASDNAKVPLVRRMPDHGPVSARDLAAIDEVVTASSRTRMRARTVAPRLARTITIPVRVHVVRGKHRHERGLASTKRIRQTIAILNRSYSGMQSRNATNTRYRFRLASIDRKTRDGWYHAYAMGPRTQRMMRALHRGNQRTLNLYINGASTGAQPVLGFSRFPWQRRANPRLDGVVVNHRALVHGSIARYNRGDTVTHEVGHWLGLFHTFQGGCHGKGDMVADTPAEAVPSYACRVGRDTCPDDPGTDPVHNFMDYSYDTCMLTFSPGQALRMDVAWSKWRQ